MGLQKSLKMLIFKSIFLKRKRLKIFKQYNKGEITYVEYVKQRLELEKQYS